MKVESQGQLYIGSGTIYRATILLKHPDPVSMPYYLNVGYLAVKVERNRLTLSQYYSPTSVVRLGHISISLALKNNEIHFILFFLHFHQKFSVLIFNDEGIPESMMVDDSFA